MIERAARPAPGRGSRASPSSGDGAKAKRGALGERLGDVHVEAAGVVGVHRRGHVLPVGRSAGSISSSAAVTKATRLGDQVERRAEGVDREVRRWVRPRPRRRARPRPAAGAPRRAPPRGELELLGLAERALGEGREPADRLDLVAEQLQPGGALLGCGEDVEDVAADRELPALFHLVDSLVAGLGEELGAKVRSISSPARSAKPSGRRDASGTVSASATALATTIGGSSAPAPVSASSAAIRSPTRCGGGATCDA